MARTIVHLVHGTWGQGFPAVEWVRRWRRSQVTWFDEHATFVQELTNVPGVEVKVFRWSGANSYLARYKAAECLAARMRDCSTDDPPQQIIIAHSHGGNVALLAQMHPWSPSLAGVITLATPFLDVRRRSDDNHLDRLLTAIQIATMLLFGTGAMIAVFAFADVLGIVPSAPVRHSSSWPFGVWNLVSIPLAFLVPIAVGTVIQRLLAVRKVVAAIKIWQPKAITPWLIQRAPGDEASRVLNFAHKGYRMFDFTWRRLRSLLVWTTRYRWSIALLLIPLASAAAVFKTLARYSLLGEPLLLAWARVVPDVGLVDIGAAVGAAMLLGLLGLGLLVFAAGAWLSPFGWELVMMGLAFDLSAQETPPGDIYKVTYVAPTWKGSRHFLYESREARESIAAWIAKLPPAATGPGSRYWKLVT